MTLRQKTYHKSLIQQLHISKRYREYFKHNRDEYEELLEKHFGVSSSKKLQIDQLIILVKYFNFQSATLPIQKQNTPNASTPAQLNTIRSIWSNYADDTSDETLLKFIRRQFKKQYLHVKNLSLKEAQILIVTLRRMQENKG